MRTYGKLREKIRNVFGTVGAFAAALNKDRSTVSKKLNGIVPWDPMRRGDYWHYNKKGKMVVWKKN